MAAIPPLAPLTPDSIGIRRLNLTTASGRDPAAGGGTVPAGQVSTTVTPCEWAGTTWVRDRDPVVIPDVAAWLGQLAAAGDVNAAEAAARFTRLNDDLLWLTRLRLAADGLCNPPVPGA
jgi:hypothetical protein